MIQSVSDDTAEPNKHFKHYKLNVPLVYEKHKFINNYKHLNLH